MTINKETKSLGMPGKRVLLLQEVKVEDTI
jgi:hypothetical protein